MSETTIVQAVALGVGLGCGWIWPREKREGLFTKESWINLLNGAVLFPLRYALTLVGIDALNVGLVPLGTLGHPVLQFLFILLTVDFARYWVHYADHRVPFLWSFHRVHHSAEALDSTTGFRMHIVDFAQLTAIPVVLYGVVFDVSHFSPWAMPAALSVGIIADAFEHSNLEFKLDTWWRRLWFQCFNSPAFHCWHHTRDGHKRDGNYANAFPFWDRLFGTDVTEAAPPELYGIEEGAIEMDFVGMQLLRPRKPTPVPASS